MSDTDTIFSVNELRALSDSIHQSLQEIRPGESGLWQQEDELKSALTKVRYRLSAHGKLLKMPEVRRGNRHTSMERKLTTISQGKETHMGKPDPNLITVKRSNHRILVVDDERIITDILDSYLTHSGFKVSCYNRAIEAIDAFRADPKAFDLAILDYEIRDLTGIEMREAILDAGGDIPMILISGWPDLNEDMIRKAGFRALVRKPCSMQSLIWHIDRVLKEADMYRMKLISRIIRAAYKSITSKHIPVGDPDANGWIRRMNTTLDDFERDPVVPEVPDCNTCPFRQSVEEALNRGDGSYRP